MRRPPTESIGSVGALAQQGSGLGHIHRERSAIPMIRENNRVAMSEGRIAPPDYPATPLFDSVFGHEALYISARKCAKGVGYKYSTQFYNLNAIEKTVDLAHDLAVGKYKEGKTHIVNITYPKPRTALAISFRDRVVQRSINDVALYPQVTRSFIWANFACQRGKGTDAARDYFKRILHSAWLKWRTNKFKVIELDVKGYYDSMRHDVTDAIFAKHCDAWTAEIASQTLSRQYKSDVGYDPGSQMVQIAGIAYLNSLDHYIKETMRIKYYLHYMDDGRIIIAPDADDKAIIEEIDGQLAKVGLHLHPKKTRTVTADNCGVFLGFKYRVTEIGRVLMFRDPEQVKAIRRKYRRMARKGRLAEIDTSYQCVRNFMGNGTSCTLLRRMDTFIKNLKKEVAHAET